jgi:hypothetical protein
MSPGASVNDLGRRLEVGSAWHPYFFFSSRERHSDFKNDKAHEDF